MHYEKQVLQGFKNLEGNKKKEIVTIIKVKIVIFQ